MKSQFRFYFLNKPPVVVNYPEVIPAPAVGTCLALPNWHSVRVDSVATLHYPAVIVVEIGLVPTVGSYQPVAWKWENGHLYPQAAPTA